MGDLSLLSFIAGAAVAIVGAWIVFSAKTRVLNEKLIRHQAETDARTSFSDELKQELTTATDEVINPVKDYMTKEVGRVEQLKIEAAAGLKNLNEKQANAMNTMWHKFEETKIKTEYSANTRGKNNELLMQELVKNTKFVEGKNVFYNTKIPEISGIPDAQFILSDTHKLIADAKAPLDTFDEYFDAQEKGDYETIKLIKTKIGKAIKDHIDELSKKNYHKAKGSFKFILMFLPSENHVQIARESSKYMQIDLENYARGKNILITGPRNFLIDLDWFDKLMSMEENNKLANELLDTINPLFSASKVLFSHFVDHSRSINQVVKSAEKINSSFSKTLINALQKVKDKGYKNPDIETTLENSEKLSESGLDQVSEPQDNLYKLDIIKRKKD